jgi:hypothetical protein
MVAEVADFLLRLEGAGGRQRSARTTAAASTARSAPPDRDTNAGDLLQGVLGAKSAGGHDQIAGGRIPLGPDPAERVKKACDVRHRFLSALGVDPEHGKPLA